MLDVAAEVDVAAGRGEKPAPIARGKAQGDPAEDGAQREGCRGEELAVLDGPALSNGQDEAADGCRVAGKATWVAGAFVQGSGDGGDEDGMALQPGVHVVHGVDGKVSLAEEGSNVWRGLFDDGVLLGNIEIADEVALAIAGNA